MYKRQGHRIRRVHPCLALCCAHATESGNTDCARTQTWLATTHAALSFCPAAAPCRRALHPARCWHARAAAPCMRAAGTRTLLHARRCAWPKGRFACRQPAARPLTASAAAVLDGVARHALGADGLGSRERGAAAAAKGGDERRGEIGRGGRVGAAVLVVSSARCWCCWQRQRTRPACVRIHA